MSSKLSKISLKSTFAYSLILMGLIALVFSVFTTTYYTKQKSNEESVRFAKSFAQIISINSRDSIIQSDKDSLKDLLTNLQAINLINNVHIYHYDELENNQLAFFASYNKQGIPLIADQKSRVKSILQPVFNDTFVEFATPITSPNGPKVIGYVYIRTQLDNYKDSVLELIKYNVLIALTLAAIAFIASLIIQRRILNPIHYFTKEIQDITFNKNYGQQVQNIPLVELRQLGESINTMLERINRQMVEHVESKNEITELNQSLEKKVVNRTQALRDSNQELLDALEQVHQYQSQVIQSEKMASLGQMVAGIAHEVNTPIGLGVTASTMLSDKIDEIQSALEDQSLSAKKLDRFLLDSKENTQIIYRNLTRAADLISSFKQVAVDQTADTTRRIKMLDFLQEVITSMQPTLKKYQHNIQINCADDLEIKSKPGPINQVIINLIMNSIIHAFNENETGVIEINAWVESGLCYIKFKDDGKGIEEKIKQKIFDPFVTTKRGEGGSGLGMHLVYNLVTQALHGQISVTSQLDHGAEFNISFPISA